MRLSLKDELIRKSQEYEFDFESGRPLDHSSSLNMNRNCGILPTLKWTPIKKDLSKSPTFRRFLQAPKRPQI
jgi:hypothetical protein